MTVEQRHRKLIAAGLRDLQQAEDSVEKARRILAERADKAVDDGMTVAKVADWMGLRPAAVYKLIAGRAGGRRKDRAPAPVTSQTVRKNAKQTTTSK